MSHKRTLTSVKVDENGNFTIDWSQLPVVIADVLPVVIETAITNPDKIWQILEGTGAVDALVDWIKENPWKFAGITAVAVATAPLWAPIAGGLVAAGAIINLGIRIVQGITEIVNDIKDAILDFFDSIKEAIDKIKEWYRNTFNRGVEYAKNNPYFKADTEKLYSYAGRLSAVNSRLRSLDSGIRDLYWQVGLLDLWDIMCADLITSKSWSIDRAKSYLTNTADRLSKADWKAKDNLGG